MILPDGLSKMISGIYVITCLSNGKCYVGSAASLAGRFYSHMSALRKGTHHGVRLQRAWNKYGDDNFLYEVIEVVSDKADLLKREQMYIDLLGSAGAWGYNSAPRAGSMAGFQHSEKTRAKMSAAHKLIGIPASTQEASRLYWTGRKLSPEVIENMRTASKGKIFSQAAHDAALAANIGHHRRHSPETRAKIGAALTGRTISDEHKAAVSRGSKGVKWTPERIAKRVATFHANRAAAEAAAQSDQLKAA